MGIISQGVHPEKAVLKVFIRIGGRKSSDEIQDLDGVSLGQKGGSLTATEGSRLAVEITAGTLLASLTTEGSPGIASAEREKLSSN